MLPLNRTQKWQGASHQHSTRAQFLRRSLHPKFQFPGAKQCALAPFSRSPPPPTGTRHIHCAISISTKEMNALNNIAASLAAIAACVSLIEPIGFTSAANKTSPSACEFRKGSKGAGSSDGFGHRSARLARAERRNQNSPAHLPSQPSQLTIEPRRGKLTDRSALSQQRWEARGPQTAVSISMKRFSFPMPAFFILAAFDSFNDPSISVIFLVSCPFRCCLCSNNFDLEE